MQLKYTSKWKYISFLGHNSTNQIKYMIRKIRALLNELQQVSNEVCLLTLNRANSG
jgi:hypothetical protein